MLTKNGGKDGLQQDPRKFSTEEGNLNPIIGAPAGE
jgi:hypothetical protein